jgi:hypothetical protein
LWFQVLVSLSALAVSSMAADVNKGKVMSVEEKVKMV